MKQLNRALALHQLLLDFRYPVPRSVILERLACSASTFKRLLRNATRPSRAISWSSQPHRLLRKGGSAVGVTLRPSQPHRLFRKRQGLTGSGTGPSQPYRLPRRKLHSMVTGELRLLSAAQEGKEKTATQAVRNLAVASAAINNQFCFKSSCSLVL